MTACLSPMGLTVLIAVASFAAADPPTMAAEPVVLAIVKIDSFAR